MRYPEHQAVLKDSRGRYRTQSLFEEFKSITPAYEPLWTLKELKQEGGLLPSLRDLYMEISDPTEYAFAMEAFGSYKQWLKIKNNKSIMVWIDDWAFELEVKIRSEGIRGVAEEAKSGKAKFNASKAMAEGFWSKHSQRGRPSKAEIERERKIAAKLDSEFIEDADRIGLSVVK
jgi:hypothetical protein